INLKSDRIGTKGVIDPVFGYGGVWRERLNSERRLGQLFSEPVDPPVGEIFGKGRNIAVNGTEDILIGRMEIDTIIDLPVSILEKGSKVIANTFCFGLVDLLPVSVQVNTGGIISPLALLYSVGIKQRIGPNFKMAAKFLCQFGVCGQGFNKGFAG